VSTPDLQERYRGPSRVHRVVAAVVIAGLVASGVGFIGWTVFVQSTPEVTSGLNSFTFPNDHLAEATFTVKRKSEFTRATCELVALAADHAVVGEQTVRVADGPEQQTLRVEIRTERPATSVDLNGCTAPNQLRPR
jgi:hypothetical protein